MYINDLIAETFVASLLAASLLLSHHYFLHTIA